MMGITDVVLAILIFTGTMLGVGISIYLALEEIAKAIKGKSKEPKQ